MCLFDDDKSKYVGLLVRDTIDALESIACVMHFPGFNLMESTETQ